MREIARIQQGFFPTQNRIIGAIANLFKLSDQHGGQVIIIDAGCGTGQAIHDLQGAELSDALNPAAAYGGWI
ncbi:MAG: hypothetical protein WCT04_22375 [Planctomycetota bacterium]